jgi:hypothetical protein
MSKENLFELVRKEEVILWAGAGMSIYAGYPSGNELSRILYNDLNEEIREEIDPTLPLMDMAEMYIRSKRGSRNELNQLLTKTFRVKPKATKFHVDLASIPHIKTIITTNYDNLFENAFGENGHSIFKPNQVANFGKNAVEIFKAHGDLVDPESLIISRSDYGRFFKDDLKYNLFWNAIRERLARNAVLFIGYSLEDMNVSTIFDKVAEELKQNRKQVFLVAPKISRLNQGYLSEKNIQYIDMTGEQLMEEMLKNINENIIGDFQNKKISSNILGTFLKHQNISSVLTYADGEQRIESLHPLDPSVIGSLKFSVDANDKINQSIKEYISGQKIGRLTIPKEKLLQSEIWFGNTKIFSRIDGLTIKSVPSGMWNVMIRFEDGFEYDDVAVSTYKTEESILALNVQLKRVSLEIKINFKQKNSAGYESQLSYTHEHACGRAKDEIAVFTLLSKLSNGDGFRIFHLGKIVHTGAYNMMKPMHSQLDSFLKFFEGLRQIENHYQLVFRDIIFDEIDNTAAGHITEILAFIEDGHVDENFKEGMKIELDSDPRERLRELAITDDLPKDLLELRALSEHVFFLFGHEFNLGFMVYQIIKPIAVNRKRVGKGLDKFIHLKSKTNQRIKFFTETYTP